MKTILASRDIPNFWYRS